VMPHAKFEPGAGLTDLWKAPPAFAYTIQQKNISFKFEESYLAKGGGELLFNYAVVEGRLVQHVLVQLLDEGGVHLLKLKRNSPVLRTEGVKLLLAIVASYLEEKGARLLSSSLDPYLGDGRFYEKHIFAP